MIDRVFHRNTIGIALPFTLMMFATCLSSCVSSSVEFRMNVAQNIAVSNGLHKIEIKTNLFTLVSYEKISKKNAPATIYIEGDGLAWLSRSTPSRNPTPKDPTGLRLASRDKVNDNIIYIARPCQYGNAQNGNPCRAEYWTSKRFAPEVLENMGQALDNIKMRHNITKLNLVGYSGGAAIAVLLAAKRDDVISLRTVAGNVANAAFNNLHNVSQMPASLDPSNVSYKLSTLPQQHFVGGKDDIVPLSIFKSYENAAGPSNCIKYTLVPSASHNLGWDDLWATLLTMPVQCN